MTEHDPMCRAKHMPVETDIDDLDGCDCALIAKVRAEYEGEREAWEETMRRYVNGVLADLRAKVLRLTLLRLEGWDVVLLGDVLALIDGRDP